MTRASRFARFLRERADFLGSRSAGTAEPSPWQWRPPQPRAAGYPVDKSVRALLATAPAHAFSSGFAGTHRGLTFDSEELGFARVSSSRLRADAVGRSRHTLEGITKLTSSRGPCLSLRRRRRARRCPDRWPQALRAQGHQPLLERRRTIRRQRPTAVTARQRRPGRLQARTDEGCGCRTPSRGATMITFPQCLPASISCVRGWEGAPPNKGLVGPQPTRDWSRGPTNTTADGPNNRRVGPNHDGTAAGTDLHRESVLRPFGLFHDRV